MSVLQTVLCYMSLGIVEEQFSYMSQAGIIIAVALGAVAVIAAFAAPIWFPRLSVILSSRKSTRWLASPQFGRILPFACAFMLFPISGFFSTSNLTFWLFLLFGWGAAAILLYVGKLVDDWR